MNQCRHFHNRHIIVYPQWYCLVYHSIDMIFRNHYCSIHGQKLCAICRHDHLQIDFPESNPSPKRWPLHFHDFLNLQPTIGSRAVWSAKIVSAAIVPAKLSEINEKEKQHWNWLLFLIIKYILVEKYRYHFSYSCTCNWDGAQYFWNSLSPAPAQYHSNTAIYCAVPSHPVYDRVS